MPRKTIPCNTASRWLHLISLFLLLPTSWAASKATLTIDQFSKTRSYRAEVWNALDENIDFFASLATPPDDAQLCEFPTSLLDEDNNTILAPWSTPIALLVSIGGCSISDKAVVALDIRKKVTKALQYVIFYNNNPDSPDEIEPLRSSDFMFTGYNFDLLRLVSISTASGTAIMGRIEKLAEATGNSPEFLSENNSGWDLPILLERSSDEGYDRSGVYSDQQTSGHFFWFRFVFFTVLIVSPCFRAGYLWWASGGRIQFRRNENGRIVGLQYIPPMSYWFASNGGGQDGGSPMTDRLTEEQIMALPEISYVPPLEASQDNCGENLNTAIDTEEIEEVDIVLSSGTVDSEQKILNTKDSDTPTLESLPCSTDADEEQPEEPPADSESLKTTCTTCSICIDDYVVGERIRLLPRCKHAFHTECILPWLTGRQGCCPLCKVSVLEPGGEQTNNEQPVDQEPSPNVDGDTGLVRADREQAPRDAPLSSEDPIIDGR